MTRTMNNFLQVLDTIWNQDNWMEPNTLRVSSTDVKDKQLVLTWDLPGAKKDEIDIETDNNILIVKGVEGRYKGLSSRVSINRDFDLKSTDATLKDGVLTVSISQGKTLTGTKINIK